MCPNAYSASPAIDDCLAGRTNSLRDNSRNIPVTVVEITLAHLATAPAQNTLPITAASASSDLASGSSVSSRAAISACTESGNGTSAPPSAPSWSRP